MAHEIAVIGGDGIGPEVTAQALIKTVISKVPEEAQSIAQQLAAGLTDVLKQSQDDFSDQNCKNSGKPGSGGDSSSSAAAGGSTSAAAPPTESTSAPAEGTDAPTMTSAAPGVEETMPSGGSGGSPTDTNSPPVVTGGAGAMAPLGALAVAVAALLL